MVIQDTLLKNILKYIIKNVETQSSVRRTNNYILNNLNSANSATFLEITKNLMHGYKYTHFKLSSL